MTLHREVIFAKSAIFRKRLLSAECHSHDRGDMNDIPQYSLQKWFHPLIILFPSLINFSYRVSVDLMSVSKKQYQKILLKGIELII
jgi:hypothetical protein